MRIELLRTGDGRLAEFKFLLHRYHYLGLRTCVGENLKYQVYDRQGRLLARLLFGAAAWKAQARDRFIGWNVAGRQRHSLRLTNNARFLIAAGWQHAGATAGRSRNDVNNTLRVPVKDIYLLPLTEDFRRRLCAPACSLPDGRAGR